MTLAVPTWQRPNPSRKSTDTAVYGEEGTPDDYDGEQDEPEDDEVNETDLAAFLGTLGEDPEADDALAEALQLDAVAMVEWQRFSEKGKGKSKGREKAKVKGKNKGSNLSFEKRLAELKSRTNCQACGARGHCGRRRHLAQKNTKSDGSPQPPAGRGYLALGGETPCFDLALLGGGTSADATALVAHARLGASDILVETPKAPPGARRPQEPPRVIPSPPPPTPQSAWRVHRVQPSRHERQG